MNGSSLFGTILVLAPKVPSHVKPLSSGQTDTKFKSDFSQK